MIALERYREAFLTLPDGIKEAEVNGETHDAITVFIEQDTLANVQVSMQKALYLRVSGDKTGYYYTQNLDEDPYEAMNKAYENSLYSEQTGTQKINKTKTEQIREEKEAIKDVAVLTEMAVSLTKQVVKHLDFEENQIHISASLKAETYGQHTVNSYGVDISFTHPVYLFDITVNVEENGKQATADLSLAVANPNEFNMERTGKELNLRCKAQFGPVVSIKSGEYPVILSNSTVYYLFGTGWQLFSGCRYVEGTTKLQGMLGERIGTDCLTISDKTSLNGKGFPMYYDSEGNEGKDCVLLEQGIFKGLLHNISSSDALQMDLTGNAGRRPLLYGNIATDIQVTPKNFCITPGQSDLNTMIKNMQNGILITESFDIFHTIDISSGNFSIPCWGIKIEDGEPVGSVLSMMMTGNIIDLLKNVVEVGDNFILHPMVAIENYGIGTCPLRISKVNLSGE